MTGAYLPTLRSRLVGSVAVTVFLAATPAFAQVTGANQLGAQTPASGTQQDIVVTGSRIATSNTTSEAPVTVVTSKQIAQSSSQTVQDVLRKLPTIGTSGNFATTNNGGQGSSCLDIRNLGITRTLILVDGKRVVHSGIFGIDCVDLDNVPVAMIDRIEILKDGASSIYGADAVAGVINIILKKNFVGTQINLGGDITASGDDREGQISGTTGFDFAQGRGNFALSGSYLDRGPVAQRDRDWANPIPQNNVLATTQRFGSSIPLGGRVFDSPNSANPVIGGGSLLAQGNGRFRPFSNATDRFNFGDYQYLSGSVRTANVAGSSHFDVNEQITAYVNGFYTHKETRTQLAPQPVTGALGGGLPDVFVVPAGNPYNPFGEDVSMFRRVGEFGPRHADTSQDTYQITGGLRGNLGHGWDYDAFYLYGKSQNTIRSNNEVNYQRLEQEMGFRQTNDPAAADPSAAGVYDPTVCPASSGCVLANPFGPNSISQGAVNYARFTERAQATFFLRDVGVNLTNSKVFSLPYGPVGVAFGVDHRGEQGSYHPDPLVVSGVTLENSQQPTAGGFNTTEVYGEARIPILANLPGVKDLSSDISGRFSNYNTFGSAETWKAGLNYTPVEDIRFRANIGTAFRQPSINELFGGQALSFNQGNDPCAQIGTYGAAAGIVGANCARQGLGQNFTQTNSQVRTIQGGNPNLQPETARTYTIGTVIQPRWVKNLSATVDYWHTRIQRSISSLTTQAVLDGCYTSANLLGPLCNDVARRDGAGQLTTVTAINQNLGVTRTNGIDFELNYLIRLGGGHTLSLQNDFTDTLGYTAQNVPNGQFINYNGRILYSGNPPTGYARYRDNATVTYAKGGFSFGYTMRYIDGMTLNNGLTDAVAGINRTVKTNEVFYHDIVATYAWRKISLIAGIDNLLDRTPPFTPDAATNSDPSVYDFYGRLFYLKTQFRF
jgi:iron complex outermembrane receptor protein